MGACLSGANSKDDQLWAYIRPDEKTGQEFDATQLEVLQTLLASGQVNVNSRRQGGDTPMHWVVREQAPPSVALIDWLAQYRPDLELHNDAQKTPLHCASGGRHVEHVKRLVSLQANVNAPGAFRSTPLMYACALGLHANADALLDAPGLNITIANANGDTALNRLARLGARERNAPQDLALAERMIALGADVDKANNEGFTPLLSACAAGKANLLAYFIGIGASMDVRNSYGEGVQELATRDHVKFVFRAYDALRELVAFERTVAALVLSYAIQHPSEAK